MLAKAREGKALHVGVLGGSGELAIFYESRGKTIADVV